MGIIGAVIGFGYTELTGVPFIARFNLGAVIVLAVIGAIMRPR